MEQGNRYDFLRVKFIANFDAYLRLWQSFLGLYGSGLFKPWRDTLDFDEGGFGLGHCCSRADYSHYVGVNTPTQSYMQV
jgi:hypothetical protein